jgi:hypothetical protein
MQTSDWDSSEIRAIGRRWAVQAYDIASELSDFGADASALLKPYDSTRPHDVTIPSMLADVVMAVLLALPRQEGAPEVPRRECREDRRGQSQAVEETVVGED